MCPADEYVELARTVRSKHELLAELEGVFPKAERSAEKAQPLKNLFFTACPEETWKVRALMTSGPN